MSKHCSGHRREAVMAFQNGSIRVYLLTDKKTFGPLGPHWTGWAHDQDYGDISSIAFSYDDRYVFSTGLDGNFFVFQTAETAKFVFGAQSVQPERIPSHTVSDADSSHIHNEYQYQWLK